MDALCVLTAPGRYEKILLIGSFPIIFNGFLNKIYKKEYKIIKNFEKKYPFEYLTYISKNECLFDIGTFKEMKNIITR